MCVTNSEGTNKYLGYVVGGPYGAVFNSSARRSDSSAPRRKFFGPEGQTATIRTGEQKYQGLLADPAAVQSLLATGGKAPKKGSLLGG